MAARDIDHRYFVSSSTSLLVARLRVLADVKARGFVRIVLTLRYDFKTGSLLQRYRSCGTERAAQPHSAACPHWTRPSSTSLLLHRGRSKIAGAKAGDDPRALLWLVQSGNAIARRNATSEGSSSVKRKIVQRALNTKITCSIPAHFGLEAAVVPRRPAEQT